MDTLVARYNRALKHVYSEPKFVAQVEYMRDHPSPMQQILGQIPRQAVEQYIDGQGWPDDVAEQTVTVEMPEPMPDFDWWEPRHDQPWRRQHARDRAAGFDPAR